MDNLWDKLNETGRQSGVTLQRVCPKELVFEENVHLNCYYCGRYNNNWRCPPKTPALNYEKIINEFENHIFVYNRYDITPENESSVRVDSTNHLHKALLAMEKVLFEHGYASALSFIGGSCKLCKNGCGETRCNNPYQSRMPLEATGMNVQKSAGKHGIEVAWPVVDAMLRIGMLMW